MGCGTSKNAEVKAHGQPSSGPRDGSQPGGEPAVTIETVMAPYKQKRRVRSDEWRRFVSNVHELCNLSGTAGAMAVQAPLSLFPSPQRTVTDGSGSSTQSPHLPSTSTYLLAVVIAERGERQDERYHVAQDVVPYINDICSNMGCSLEVITCTPHSLPHLTLSSYIGGSVLYLTTDDGSIVIDSTSVQVIHAVHTGQGKGIRIRGESAEYPETQGKYGVDIQHTQAIHKLGDSLSRILARHLSSIARDHCKFLQCSSPPLRRVNRAGTADNTHSLHRHTVWNTTISKLYDYLHWNDQRPIDTDDTKNGERRNSSPLLLTGLSGCGMSTVLASINPIEGPTAPDAGIWATLPAFGQPPACIIRYRNPRDIFKGGEMRRVVYDIALCVMKALGAASQWSRYQQITAQLPAATCLQDLLSLATPQTPIIIILEDFITCQDSLDFLQQCQTLVLPPYARVVLGVTISPQDAATLTPALSSWPHHIEMGPGIASRDVGALLPHVLPSHARALTPVGVLTKDRVNWYTLKLAALYGQYSKEESGESSGTRDLSTPTALLQAIVALWHDDIITSLPLGGALPDTLITATLYALCICHPLGGVTWAELMSIHLGLAGYQQGPREALTLTLTPYVLHGLYILSPLIEIEENECGGRVYTWKSSYLCQLATDALLNDDTVTANIMSILSKYYAAAIRASSSSSSSSIEPVKDSVATSGSTRELYAYPWLLFQTGDHEQAVEYLLGGDGKTWDLVLSHQLLTPIVRMLSSYLDLIPSSTHAHVQAILDIYSRHSQQLQDDPSLFHHLAAVSYPGVCCERARARLQGQGFPVSQLPNPASDRYTYLQAAGLDPSPAALISRSQSPIWQVLYSSDGTLVAHDAHRSVYFWAPEQVPHATVLHAPLPAPQTLFQHPRTGDIMLLSTGEEWSVKSITNNLLLSNFITQDPRLTDYGSPVCITTHLGQSTRCNDLRAGGSSAPPRTSLPDDQGHYYLLAMGHQSGTITLWGQDLQHTPRDHDGVQLLGLVRAHDRTVTDLALFSRGKGSALVSGGTDGVVTLVLQLHACVQRKRAPVYLRQHQCAVTTLALPMSTSSNGEVKVFVSGDGSGRILAWQLPSVTANENKSDGSDVRVCTLAPIHSHAIQSLSITTGGVVVSTSLSGVAIHHLSHGRVVYFLPSFACTVHSRAGELLYVSYHHQVDPEHVSVIYRDQTVPDTASQAVVTLLRETAPLPGAATYLQANLLNWSGDRVYTPLPWQPALLSHCPMPTWSNTDPVISHAISPFEVGAGEYDIGFTIVVKNSSHVQGLLLRCCYDIYGTSTATTTATTTAAAAAAAAVGTGIDNVPMSTLSTRQVSRTLSTSDLQHISRQSALDVVLGRLSFLASTPLSFTAHLTPTSGVDITSATAQVELISAWAMSGEPGGAVVDLQYLLPLRDAWDDIDWAAKDSEEAGFFVSFT